MGLSIFVLWIIGVIGFFVGMKNTGTRGTALFLLIFLFSCVLALSMILFQRYESECDYLESQITCGQVERDDLFSFIKSTREYLDRMEAFAALIPGDLVFESDGDVYLVTTVHEPAGDSMPDIECRDLRLSRSVAIFIEGENGWKYRTMKQGNECYHEIIMGALVPRALD